jgi:hypothetical protein
MVPLDVPTSMHITTAVSYTSESILNLVVILNLVLLSSYTCTKPYPGTRVFF